MNTLTLYIARLFRNHYTMQPPFGQHQFEPDDRRALPPILQYYIRYPTLKQIADANVQCQAHILTLSPINGDNKAFIPANVDAATLTPVQCIQ